MSATHREFFSCCWWISSSLNIRWAFLISMMSARRRWGRISNGKLTRAIQTHRMSSEVGSRSEIQKKNQLEIEFPFRFFFYNKYFIFLTSLRAVKNEIFKRKFNYEFYDCVISSHSRRRCCCECCEVWELPRLCCCHCRAVLDNFSIFFFFF